MREHFMLLRVMAVAAALALVAGADRDAKAQGAAPAATPEPSRLPKPLDLAPEQRDLVFASLRSKTHRSTAAPPNFLPEPGAVVPASVELMPIPDVALELVPSLRDYVCALIANQAVIVDPKTRQVIEVITEPPEPRAPPAPE
ncbi:MAG: DUF1236 domain-containing protein [Variibacter sp.]|nr:DUF1236 domain-containing protein [Variibacter sp.]